MQLCSGMKVRVIHGEKGQTKRTRMGYLLQRDIRRESFLANKPKVYWWILLDGPEEKSRRLISRITSAIKVTTGKYYERLKKGE